MDWAGNLDDCTSTGAFLIFLSANPISWSSKKQRTIARSSTKAEYHAIAVVAIELKWVKSLLSELLVSLQSLPTLFSDNLDDTYLSTNHVFHSHMKHLTIDYTLFVTWFSRLSYVFLMSLLVTSLLMLSPNPSLGLASFPYVTRLVLSLAHHL